ncbi:MAG: DUF1819 family protein [Chloroflexota bacterium]
MMTEEPYSMSFTTGTLLYHESLTVAELYEELGDWGAVRERVVDGNLLQMRTFNSSKRVCNEVISRLRELTPVQRALLREGTRQEQNYLLWLGVCKRYRFIYEFAVTVVREKFLRLDLALGYEEYDLFFHDKAEWHPEVEAVAESTRSKQRQVIFKMMREAELLSPENVILPAMLSPALIEAIARDQADYLAIYPVSGADVSEWLR